MEMKSTDQATLYPSLEPLKALAPNAYDNLPEEHNANREAAHTFRLHKVSAVGKCNYVTGNMKLQVGSKETALHTSSCDIMILKTGETPKFNRLVR
jgi:hypothetical protein